MNTDCKMYMNLINSQLSPWVVSLLHEDQKGFIPRQLITEHTCLVAEVVHLSNSTDSDGYVVSLDQAKAYDRTVLPWLLDVMRVMGVDPDLISLIADMTHQCHTRVRINGAYSRPYSLRRGVQQGDPLSCLLYDFSIEPMGMALQRTVKGVSTLGLPPVKLIQFADDMNLFLSMEDNPEVIGSTLHNDGEWSGEQLRVRGRVN